MFKVCAFWCLIDPERERERWREGEKNGRRKTERNNQKETERMRIKDRFRGSCIQSQGSIF